MSEVPLKEQRLLNVEQPLQVLSALPTVGPCLGPYGGPAGGGAHSYERGTPVLHRQSGCFTSGRLADPR